MAGQVDQLSRKPIGAAKSPRQTVNADQGLTRATLSGVNAGGL